MFKFLFGPNQENLIDEIYRVGLFSFFIFISINLISTNNLSRFFVISIRYCALLMIVLSIVTVLINKRNFKLLIFSGLLYTSFFLYGIILSVTNGIENIQFERMLLNYVIVLLAIFFLTIQFEKNLIHSVVLSYVIYVILMLFITFLVGGLDLRFPPHFNYEYISMLSHEPVDYSQGVSKFFGLGSIATAYLLGKADSKFKVIFLFFIYIILLLFSFLGGARGDSLIALIISFIFLITRRKANFIKLLLFFLVTVFFYLIQFNEFHEIFDISKRFIVLMDGNFGERDHLLLQSYQLLINKPKCILLGCGFEYFQKIYNYDYGMYPHNFLAESIIVFGLPISIIFGFMVFHGMKIYIAKGAHIDFFMLYFLYDGAIALKSGELFGAWFFTAGSFFLAALAFSELTNKGRLH
jgi:hypothetical protein